MLYCNAVVLVYFACREKALKASVAMEHMIPDLLISENVSSEISIHTYLLNKAAVNMQCNEASRKPSYKVTKSWSNCNAVHTIA